MANRNVFEALNATPDGGAPKNAFDLHNFEWMTSKAGQFLPVGCREVVPDGTYDLSVDAYTMTFPCNTASQADMKENYYFMFIPYYLLTRTAYSFFPQRKDNHSALDYQFEQMPWFPLGTVVARCLTKCYNDILFDNGGIPTIPGDGDVHGFDIYIGALRLLDLLGYGCYLDIVQEMISLHNDVGEEAVLAFLNSVKENLNEYKPNALRIAAYQKAWYCYFRNTVYDNDISPKSFNFDDVTYPSDTTYNILDYRDVDDFIKQCLQIRYVQNKKDVITSSMPGTQFGAVSSIPLVFDPSDISASFTGTSATIDVPLQTAEGTYISGSNLGRNRIVDENGTQVDSSDWQNYLNDGVGGSMIPYRDVNDLSNANDRIALSPKVIHNQTYVVGQPGTKEHSLYVRHDHTYTVPGLNMTLHGNYTPAGSIAVSGTAGSSLFDVLQLTEAQAIQKWRQKSMLAGQKSKDQWRAHYGVVPAHMQDDYPDFIGSVDNKIQISQVVSQANTLADDDKSNLGDIAGRGYGASDNKKFRFHAKEFGVIMLFRSIVSENVYSSYGIDRANQLIFYNDFWQPEFQNIGLEAVPKSIIQGFIPFGMSSPSGEGGDEPLPVNSSVIGYAPRNYQLKQYCSKAHGLFNPSRFTGLSSGFIPQPYFGFGQLESFVQLRRDVLQSLSSNALDSYKIYPGIVGITLSTLYVNPAVTNSTFAFDADGYEDSDTFITKHRFNCDSVQPLSTLGLPQF